jgi:3-deoxy-D-manno-octulosonate 8-phosphate phosphatase (KDO 8-P phosphatase)
MIPTRVPQEEKSLEQRLSEVSIVVMEMEGVLTDGRTLVDAQGRESIFIGRRDVLALKMWLKDGGKLVLLARTDLAAAQEWCQNNGFNFLGHQGAKNTALQSVIFQHGATPKDVCYLGSDLEDLPPVMIAGVAVAPADADVWVRDSSHLVLASAGGQGAARELIDRLLAGRRPPTE